MSMTGTVVASPSTFGRQSFLARFRDSISSPAMVYNDPSFDVMLAHDASCPVMVGESSYASFQEERPPVRVASAERPKSNQNAKPPAADTQVSVAQKRHKLHDDEEHVGLALAETAEMHARLHRWEKAFDLWERALRKQRKRLGERHMAVGRTLLQRGQAYNRLGLFYEAILDLEAAFHIQQRESREHEIDNGEPLLLDMANTLLELGEVQQKHGSHQDAIQSLEQCLTLTQQVHGKDAHENMARIVCTIGHYQHQHRHYKEALASYRKGLKLYKQAGTPRHHPHVRWVHKCIADRSMMADRFVWSHNIRMHQDI